MKKKGLYFATMLAALLLLSAGNEKAPTPLQLTYPTRFPRPNLSTVNPLTIEGVALGRMLFYDPLLSGNNRQSCGSCHLQNLAFTDGKNLAVGAAGDTIKRNTMSLVNLAWQHQFFWDGRVQSLEDLIEIPLFHPQEMMETEANLLKELKGHGAYPALFRKAFPGKPISVETVSFAITQFLQTIVSPGVQLPDSVLPEYFMQGGKPSAEVYDGFLKEKSMRGIFFRFSEMCSPCHGGAVYGGIHMVHNGLPDVDAKSLFKAPSLVNISLSAPYMHDGRFSTLKEVMLHYRQNIHRLHELNPQLLEKPIPNLITDYDVENIERFMALFTDSSMLTNKAFADPFADKDFKWKMN